MPPTVAPVTPAPAERPRPAPDRGPIGGTPEQRARRVATSQKSGLPWDADSAVDADLMQEHDPIRAAGQALVGRRCTARAKGSGNQCRNPAVPGATVCPYHGGKAPQVRRSAAIRLASLVDPAIAVLAREMTSTTNKSADRLRAVENVLDRAGLPRAIDTDADTARQLLLERLVALRNSVVDAIPLPPTTPAETES